MIPGAFLLGAKAFIGSWWKLALGFVIAAPLFFLLGQCDGKSTQRKIDAAARAEANVEAMKTDAKATEKAAAERVNDATTVAANEEVLLDAIQDTPDTAPDAVRVRLGCARLRAQGTDISTFPACR